MADNVYQKAIKKLVFGLIIKKTGLKNETFSKVKDIKKLQYKIQLPLFSLEPTGQPSLVINQYVRWVGQFNFSIGHSFRILNYSELQNLPGYVASEEYTNALITIRFRQDGSLVRYKLAGYATAQIRYYLNPELTASEYRTIPSDVGLQAVSGTPTSQRIYRSYMNEEWYSGQVIESDFVLEVWKLQAIVAAPAVNDLDVKIVTSKLKVPDYLTEEDPVSLYTQSFDRTSAGIAFNQAFPVAIPQGLNS